MARVIDDFVAQLSNKIKAEKPAGKWPKDYAPISLWAADDQKPILVLHGSDLGLFLLGMHGHFQEMTMLERRLCK